MIFPNTTFSQGLNFSMKIFSNVISIDSKNKKKIFR